MVARKLLGISAVVPAVLYVLLVLFAPLGCNRNSQTEPFTPTDQIIAEHNRGVALMGRFDYVQAHNVFTKLAEAHPSWTDIRIDLAIAALNRQQPGDDQRAAGLLDTIIQQRPDDLRALYCRAILYLFASEPESALELFSQVVAADATDAYAQYYAGQCHFQLGRYDQALDYFRRTQQLDPYLRSAYYGAFQASQQLGDNDGAKEDFESFQKLADNPQARLAEIKYTRMGPKAEVRAFEPQPVEIPQPTGRLFAAAALLDFTSAADVSWRSFDTDALLPPITVCDFNHDGRLDGFIAGAFDGDSPNAVWLNTASGLRLVMDHPLAQVTSVTAVLWGDIDNDGLTDVYLCRRGANQLWQQNPTGTWSDITASSLASGGESHTVDGACFDADHDGDLDLFLVNADGANELLSNNRDGTFRQLGNAQGIAGDGNSRGVVLADLDTDRDVDILVINQQPPHEVYRNNRLWNYEPATGFATLAAADIYGAFAADTNADGHVEIFTAGAQGVSHWQRAEDGSWTENIVNNSLKVVAGAIAVQDLNGTGDPEIIVTTKSGWQVLSLAGELIESGDAKGWTLAALSDRGYSLLCPNSGAPPTVYQAGPGRFPVTLLRFSGQENKADQMRSNASGIGVQAAIRVGSHWAAINTFRTQSGPGQSLQPAVVGLRGQEQMDFVSVRWPDGISQSEIDLAAGQHVIEETQRQVSSCPVVFAWDGQRFQFVTDVLGVGGIGFNQGRGQYHPPRPWENLQLPDGLLQPKDGCYVIKLCEPMEEAMYLDAARLVAYDLPPGWQMVLDERLATNDPPATGQPLFYRNEFLPIAATDTNGHDVLSAIQAVDGIAAEPGPLDGRFLGRTKPRELTIDFAVPLDEVANPVLVFHGWVEYPYSQTMFAAWQANATYDAPTLSARGRDGAWQDVYESFGYMAGMPRQAALPIDPRRLPQGTTSLRIQTNLEIYFDSMRIVSAENCPEVLRRPLNLVDATVNEVGFPRRTNHAQKRPTFDYSIRIPLWDTKHLAGYYSEFGSVLTEVASVDDCLAVVGPGEEVELCFGIDSLTDSSTNRTFVLETNGWCKDRDLFTRHGETVEPLPTLSGRHRQNRIGNESNPGLTRYRSGG